MTAILRFFWRCELLFFALIFLSIKTSAQSTVAVSGVIQDPSGAPITANGTFVRFSLRNFGSQIPGAPGIPASIGWQDKDFTPDNNGNISGNIITNQAVSSPSGTFYHVCIWFRSQLFRCNDYVIGPGTFNLNTATPLVSAPTIGPSQVLTQSFACSISVASSTWTCNHNFNDTNVVVNVYDSNSKQIFPDTLTITNSNTVTLTWVTAQAGTAIIMHAGNVSIATNQPNAIVSNPTGAQSITGQGLTLSSSVPFNVNATATFTGALNANGTNTLANLDGIVYIGGAAPQIGGSADIGAQSNTAYTAAASTGGNAILFPQIGGGCYSSTTPITLTTSGKYFSIGGTYTGNQTGGVNQGVCLNYTPTTATSAATIDWTPTTGGGYSPGAGLRDFQITNNACITAGGCGSSAIGLNIGPTNGGAHKALFQNLKQSGFGVGRQINDTVGWGITDVNSTFAYNTTGLKYNTTSHENDTCLGCAFAVNGTGIELGTGSNVELSLIGGSTDGNTVKGFNNGGGVLYALAHHFENPGCSSDLFGTINGPTHIFGATMLEDCNSGTAAQLFTMTGNFLQAAGLNIFSGGRTVTNVINNSAGGVAFVTYSTPTPTLIAPGVNNSDPTKTCAIAYNCIVVRIIGAMPQMQIPVITLPFAGAGDPSCTSLGGVSNLIWNKASNNRVTMCNNGGAADSVVGGATADTFSGVKSFNAGTLLPSAAGSTDLGSTALPFGNLWLGTAATNNIKIAAPATTAARTMQLADGAQASVIPVNFTTTAVTSEVVTVQGMTASGHCTFSPTNTGAATNIAGFWLDTPASNAITIHHAATANWTVTIFCTAN